MRNTSGITMAELLLGVLFLGVGLWTLASAVKRPRPNEPDFSGAEWLASLYWMPTFPDPGAFVCPASPDSNEPGTELGSLSVPSAPNALSSNTVSYAGMGRESPVASFLRRLLGERFPGLGEDDLCVLRN